MALIGNYLHLPRIHHSKISYGEHAKNTIYERQLSHLPEETKYCSKCVMSNQRPRIVFNEEGVCGACQWAEEKENVVDWKERDRVFRDLLDKYRSKNGKYDVLVPCSGGKDSGSVAYKLKHEYDMNPLTVTWSPLLYAEIGFQNLQNMISSGLSNVLYTPNRLLQRKISKLGLVLIGNHFEAFGRGIQSYPIHVAIDLGIKLVMYGEQGELEYGGTHENKDKPGPQFVNWELVYHKGASSRELIEFGVENKYLEKDDLKDPSLKYFMLPPLEEIKKHGIDLHWFGYHNKWVPQENYYYASENYSFKPNPEGHSEGTYNKYASLDDHIDPMHYYLSFIKFGIGRATSDAAHEIREGHLTREEGVALVHRYDHIFPDKYFDDFLRYVDMTAEEFWEVVDAYREKRPNLWEKVNGEWELKHRVS